MFIECNSIRLSAHGIMTKTVYKTLPGGGGVGGGGHQGLGVVMVREVGVVGVCNRGGGN